MISSYLGKFLIRFHAFGGDAWVELSKRKFLLTLL